MFDFVIWLKVLATALITNSHFYSIWPIPSLSFGGHYGNGLFFFISGFCLFSIKENFLKWYTKRFLRIYVSVWFANVIYVLFGYFKIGSVKSIFQVFIYPTGFHFVRSIMVLYVAFYFVRFLQVKVKKIKTEAVIIFIFIVFTLLFLIMFDKSIYHIDDVDDNWVWFMFFESMLIGSLAREKYEQLEYRTIKKWILATVLFFLLYFIGKMMLRRSLLLSLQFLQPCIVVALSGCTGIVFILLEKKGLFANAGKKFKAMTGVIASMTLEIYLSQDIIIYNFSGLSFPIDFFAVIGSIILFAVTIHSISVIVVKRIKKIIKI